MLQELLDVAVVEYRTGYKKGEVTLCCPFCPERGFSEDTGFHLGLNVLNGLAHCFRCDWKCRGLLATGRILAKVWGLTFRLRYQSEKPEEEKEEVQEEDVAVGLPLEYEKFGKKKNADPVERRARSYLKSRGVSMSQVLRHKIGFAAVGDMAWRILFPIMSDDGAQIQGCVGRAFDVRQPVKYLNTSGTKLMWNAHREGSVAVVCEGILDALMVERVLLRRRGWVPIARLGSTATLQQLAQLKKYETVLILPDWDTPGVKGATKLALQCVQAHLNTQVAIPDELNGRDPGLMSEEEIEVYMGTALPWKKETEWRLRTIPIGVV